MKKKQAKIQKKLQKVQSKFIKKNTQNDRKKQIKPLKVVAVSDTHGFYTTCVHLMNDKGDIFIHAGDFTHYGSDQDIDSFIVFLQKLDFKHKIIIAGNHQISIQGHTKWKNTRQKLKQQHPYTYTRQDIIKRIKQKAIYLQHQYVQVEGLKIFGSPYTLAYSLSAFQYQQDQAQMYWDLIPENLDILITHGPPYSILDKNRKNVNGGCSTLLKKVQLKKPKYHIFGHIHQGHGRITIQNTTYLNVAYKPQIILFQ